jgi:maltose-binding protein MalE
MLAPITLPAHIAQINEQVPLAAQSSRIGTTHFAFPFSNDTHVLFYNSSKISGAPLDAIETIISRASSSTDQLANAFGLTPIGWFTFNFFLTFGVRIFANGNEADLSQLAGPNALAAMSWLNTNGPKMSDLGKGEIHEMLGAGGGVQTVIDGPFALEPLRNHIGDSLSVRALPTIDIEGTATPMISHVNSQMWGVNALRDSDRREVVMEVAAHLSNRASQEYAFDEYGIIPSHQAFRTAIAARPDGGGQLFRAINEQASKPGAVATPNLAAMNRVWIPLQNVALDAFRGNFANQAAIQTALTNMLSIINNPA